MHVVTGLASDPLCLIPGAAIISIAISIAVCCVHVRMCTPSAVHYKFYMCVCVCVCVHMYTCTQNSRGAFDGAKH